MATWRWVLGRSPVDPVELNLLRRALARQPRIFRAVLFVCYLLLAVSPLLLLLVVGHIVAPGIMTQSLDDRPQAKYLIPFLCLPVLFFGLGFAAVCITWCVRRFSLMSEEALEAFFRLGPRS
jgi:hypothetical protein